MFPLRCRRVGCRLDSCHLATAIRASSGGHQYVKDLAVYKMASVRQRPKSKLMDWDRRAVVRVSPRRELQDEEAMGRLYFSPALVPVIDHPIVRGLGPSIRRTITIQHLYRYLDFTAQFETTVVNSAVQSIASRRAPLQLPEEMIFDAYKIYCDEAYHAVFSADFRYQMEAVTGLAPLGYDFQAFLGRLDAVQSVVPDEVRGIVPLFTAIVFETLISNTLVKIPNDEQVVTAVRQMVADHAEDEAHHHTYFSSLMDIAWPQLTSAQRSAIGTLLPHLIRTLLEPDYCGIRKQMLTLGLTADEAAQVVEESYPPAELAAGIKNTARATINLLERNGLFEIRQSLDGFSRCGLL
jgi:hypothetical protein